MNWAVSPQSRGRCCDQHPTPHHPQPSPTGVPISLFSLGRINHGISSPRDSRTNPLVNISPLSTSSPLRRVSKIYDVIIFHLLSRTRNNPYLTSWSMILTTSSGRHICIPLSLERTRHANDWKECYHRPYIFSGPISGIHRSDQAQVLKFQFWDEKHGPHAATRGGECRLRCCGL